tara:strand:- start:370 stop:930 length:561 start_codon:yes stop_codon:yes gene_type:complete
MRFNLDDYETVQERLARFLKDYPDARIITENLTTPQDRAVLTWVFKTTIYLSDADQANGLPKATGHAFEIDGQKGANLTSAMENAETSSLGRCLANFSYHGDRRVTRTEMEKVERGVTPSKRDWLSEALKLDSLDDLRGIWMDAKAGKASEDVLKKIQELADGKRDSGELSEGADGSIRTSGDETK